MNLDVCRPDRRAQEKTKLCRTARRAYVCMRVYASSKREEGNTQLPLLPVKVGQSKNIMASVCASSSLEAVDICSLILMRASCRTVDKTKWIISGSTCSIHHWKRNSFIISFVYTQSELELLFYIFLGDPFLGMVEQRALKGKVHPGNITCVYVGKTMTCWVILVLIYWLELNVYFHEKLYTVLKSQWDIASTDTIEILN